MRNFGPAILLVGVIIALAVMSIAGESQFGAYCITGPYTHENLSVFLIHGEDQVSSENLLTLSEALEQKKVIVHETGSVGQLAIENVSDEAVFIQSGDIVKGGKQDRVIPVSVVVSPGSGKLPLESFCVERGRWSQRGDEEITVFSTSDKQLASKELKVAAKVKKSQGAVWDGVGEVYIRGGRAAEVGYVVDSEATSLQLALESKPMEDIAKPYIDAISTETDRADDVVGIAFAINGEINSADVFRSRALFEQLSTKLIESCAIEAATKRGEDSVSAQLTSDDIAAWLIDAVKGEKHSQKVNDFTDLKTTENKTDVVFETIGVEDSTVIHLNVLKK